MAQQDDDQTYLPISLFEPGNKGAITIHVKKKKKSQVPAQLLLVAPQAEGTYPVLLFCHGYCTENSWYSHFLEHISSHGYIVVAPQFYQCLLVSLNNEVQTAAEVADWLSTGLATSLPKNVKPDLSKLALMGHSRGGKTAFALALGHAPTALKFKALLALDPVSGPKPPTWVEPNILSYVPHSFNLSIPIGIIGTGLSSQAKGVIPPLAPNGFNHAEFFNESRPPCCYFLAKDYGHCDILNDSKAALASLVCKSGKDSKQKMRRGAGGIVVAFLKAYLGGETNALQSIIDITANAPITLDPIIHITV
ncbi:chlorophyllase-1-like [Andrographis paniculata]|uniref:chlorophyllase-1-like n=1 Tax=Andrographis paniculata TaxID=175694 RepID=UPI0021E98059|nr:chlorophyllase-1-like [Andrographis paniculata]